MIFSIIYSITIHYFIIIGVFDNGIPGYWYKLPDNVFDTPDQNPAQACYCDPKVKTCLPKGLSDITPCYYSKYSHDLKKNYKIILYLIL